MTIRTHNSEVYVRALVQPIPGCVGLLGWFSNFQ